MQHLIAAYRTASRKDYILRDDGKQSGQELEFNSPFCFRAPESELRCILYVQADHNPTPKFVEIPALKTKDLPAQLQELGEEVRIFIAASWSARCSSHWNEDD